MGHSIDKADHGMVSLFESQEFNLKSTETVILSLYQVKDLWGVIMADVMCKCGLHT